MIARESVVTESKPVPLSAWGTAVPLVAIRTSCKVQCIEVVGMRFAAARLAIASARLRAKLQLERTTLRRLRPSGWILRNHEP